ncbi:MAG: hypothetical protein WBP58_16510 [Chitinophagaceae bacterium]
MELEQWKDIWKKQEDSPTPSLREILGKPSNSPIAKMKRNLVLELITLLLSFGAIVVYYLSAYKGKFQEVGWIYFFIIILFVVYFILKYRLLTRMECMACEVKSNLMKQVHTLEKYVRFYLIAGTALIPIMIIFFYIFSWMHFPQGRGLFLMPSDSTSLFTSLLILFLLCLTSTIGMYYLNKWYIRKLYGNQIARLKTMLDQLD